MRIVRSQLSSVNRGGGEKLQRNYRDLKFDLEQFLQQEARVSIGVRLSLCVGLAVPGNRTFYNGLVTTVTSVTIGPGLPYCKGLYLK